MNRLRCDVCGGRVDELVDLVIPDICRGCRFDGGEFAGRWLGDLILSGEDLVDAAAIVDVTNVTPIEIARAA